MVRPARLRIPPHGAFDFIALGALNYRLDPGVVPFRKATALAIQASGAEFNVAANLADCFQLRSGLVSAMVDYPIGHLIAERVRAMGVETFYKTFAHDGVSGPNMATVYSDRGYGVRAPVVFYNRANEAAAQLRPGDFDWNDVFAGGTRWFHSSGVFAALSSTTSELIVEGMKAAKAVGAVTSFDLNYRKKLWSRWDEKEIRNVFRRIIKHVDVLVGNEQELQQALGVSGPSVTRTKQLDPDTFIEMIERVVVTYPTIRVVATTLREVISGNRHRWSAVAWFDGNSFVAPTVELDVLDRIGGGDGFASGLFYGLLAGEEPNASLNLGWAHGALLTTFPSDSTMARLDDVTSLARGGSARVRR